MSRARSSRTGARSRSTTARSPARSCCALAAASGERRMNLNPKEIAVAIGAEVIVEGPSSSPVRATIDSGAIGAGDLFFGLRGQRVDGGEHAPAAIEAGAWGVVVGPDLMSHFSPHGGGKDDIKAAGAWVFVVDDPLVALQSLARAYRRALGARVV